MARRSRFPALAGWATLAFLYLPIVVMAAFSWNGGRYASRWDGLSTKWYAALFDPRGSGERAAEGLAAPLSLSLRLAGAAAVVAVVLSALLGVGLRRVRGAFAAPLVALWALPILLPDVVLGVSWAGAFERLGLAPGFLPLLLAHATMAAAFGFVVVRARMATLDDALVEAARDLGATRAGAMRHVVLPHLKPALVATALLAVTLSFDDFMVSFFLAPPAEPTLPIRVYGHVVRGASPVLLALATIALAATFALAAVFARALPSVRRPAGDLR